jgi:pimeloyl-ACP methyl ester carboxylesterase
VFISVHSSIAADLMMRLQHGRTSLALHELQAGSGPALLLLHQLHGRASDWSSSPIEWPGPIYALDFSGHGESDSLAGGAYTCELLAADADCALAACGVVALAGAGLGAYVALLLSGARAQVIAGTLLLPGRGLAGGADRPERMVPAPLREDVAVRAGHGPDPLISVLERDIRPPDYARAFASQARALLLCRDGAASPPWWQAISELPQTLQVKDSMETSVRELARIAMR